MLDETLHEDLQSPHYSFDCYALYLRGKQMNLPSGDKFYSVQSASAFALLLPCCQKKIRKNNIPVKCPIPAVALPEAIGTNRQCTIIVRHQKEHHAFFGPILKLYQSRPLYRSVPCLFHQLPASPFCVEFPPAFNKFHSSE